MRRRIVFGFAVLVLTTQLCAIAEYLGEVYGTNRTWSARQEAEMLNTHLADLIEKMTKQAQAMGFGTVEEALDRMEELHSKALKLTYPDLEEALYDLGHYRLGDPSVHDRAFEEEQRRGAESQS